MVGGHVNLVRHRGEVIRAAGGRLGIGHHGLAALAELGEGGAEFLHGGGAAGSGVRPEEDILDTGIGRGGLDGLDGVPEAHGRTAGGHPEHRDARAEGVVLRLLSEGELFHVDVQHTFPGQDRLAAAETHGTDHGEQQEKADELHHDERADHGQHHFDKIFHATVVFDKTLRT